MARSMINGLVELWYPKYWVMKTGNVIVPLRPIAELIGETCIAWTFISDS